MTCIVCRGEQVIRLPLYHSVSVVSFNTNLVPPIMQQEYKEYSCPECKRGSVKYEKVQSIAIDNMWDTRIDTPEYRKYQYAKMAHMIGMHLLEKEWIKFEIGKEDIQSMKREIRAIVYIVAPKNMITFMQRVQEQAIKLAWNVVLEAKKQINNWGSFYQHDNISKARATMFLDETYDAFRSDIQRNQNVK